MGRKKDNYEELFCPVCQENAELLAKMTEQLRLAQERQQQLEVINTKNELVLQKFGLTEELNNVSEVESICVMQIKKLLEVASLRALTETEAKILDILHKNLRASRGEKVDVESKKKMKAIPMEELLTLIKSE